MNNLITNNQSSNFYNYLLKYLDECNSFIFNVAFINFSGLQLLLDSFSKLEKKGIKGKILTSTYLNFTQPKALEKIKEFTNIELKIYDNEDIGFHSKAYIFELDNNYEIIVGSSNITASAFKTNIEWNIKTTASKYDIFTNNIIKEFDLLWNSSYYVNKDFLEKYILFYNKNKKIDKFVFNNDIKTNKMQDDALKKIEYFKKIGERKALVIAATGTGKTYLSAFEIKKCKPKRLLFLVHRENILLKAKESFESILSGFSCGLYTGNKKEINCDYLFATIQTMTSNYHNFDKNAFDYIIVDEAHHISSPTYERVIKYFNTSFLLGLTATPNRMDNKSIYEVFDENIACDIRLSDALDYKLVCPFHYYGISDIKSLAYENVNLNKIDELSKLLMVNKRVDYILEKMNFYSYSGKKRKVLGFCASKEHCLFMSEEFNKRGIKSSYLTSKDSIDKRESEIKNLEDENHDLEVIFTVDIFNEGIDIPSINTVLLLRPTNSPIIFIQQLGRGLRKHKNKDFLTLLDFIGNHNKAYLIALALIGNKAIDKESIKFALKNNFTNIQNAFINMDEISKQRILEQIEKENFNSLKYLKEEYFVFKNQMKNKIPKLTEYIQYSELINPLKFIYDSKSYIEFLVKVEKNDDLKELVSNEEFLKVIRFIESLLPVKRVYEFVIIKYLLKNEYCDEKKAHTILLKYLNTVNKETILHSFKFLNHDYLDKGQRSRYLRLVNFDKGRVRKSDLFNSILENSIFKRYIEDSINYGILIYEKNFGLKDFGLPFFKLYEKYNMLNIAQLCNYNKIHSSFRGSGFLKYNNDFFLFISLEKENFTKASKYDNAFLSKDIFTYVSKPSMSQEKGDGLRLIDNKKNKVKLHIFVRKFAQVDKKTQNFIYLGLANTIKYEGNKPISLHLKLEEPLSDKLYEEFIKIV